MGPMSIRIQHGVWKRHYHRRRQLNCLHVELLYDFAALHACDPFDLCSEHAVKLVPMWRSHSMFGGIFWWVFVCNSKKKKENRENSKTENQRERSKGKQKREKYFHMCIYIYRLI